MSTDGPRLSFWFEFASTYSYLAAARMGAAAHAAGIAIDWRPFLLGPIFADQGMTDSPFNLFAAKGAYMWRDMARLAGDLGLPFQRPSQFPRNGLLAARVATAGLGEAWAPGFVVAVYRANFGEDKDIADPALLAALVTAAGGDGTAALAAAATPAVKDRLRASTQAAKALGIFGAPSFTTPDGELFWGNDRLEQAFAWARRGY
ncbi:2-hydroxychromene-2-carboxylate isomerase [Oleomonas cavernae]|uniref:2-hydroxychromene-2-carboxylate isomerase n=1 Tax=Oleomonas cavernae TaxID=2320859 RepID=A0A418WFZ8_9PROT|nr:DsbA family protein [Oleomonas cavernae]RJF88955.1 2-hydroxychromene-2-carboxylate isomerase [Oleomonas cavernae]